METQQASRRYVDVLVKWAVAPEERAAIRKLMDPADKGLCDWVAQLAGPYYDARYEQFEGGDIEDFTEECRLTLLRQAKSQPSRLLDPDFSDEQLKRIIQWIAKCRSIDLRRRLKTHKFIRIDESGDDDDDQRRRPPPVPWVEQEHWSFDLYPVREIEHRQARDVVSAYASTIRGQRMRRKVLAFFMRYTHQLGKEVACPCHWLVLHILVLRRVHLSEDLRSALCLAFPHLSYDAINGHLGHLRRSFRKFLAGRALEKWAESITGRFFTGRAAPA
ncbi:MAG: hypothetical protein ACREOI_18935 [bacterium]